MLRNRLLPIVIISLLQTFCPDVEAGVYKYQDKNGKWHFTDKPPKDANNSTLSSVGSQQKRRDVKQELFDRFKPDSEVDQATLSVVTVKTAAGNGSGFFVTDDGFLITNRHVVRPTTSSQARDAKAILEERDEQLKSYKSQLDDEEERLDQMRATIDENRDYAESDSASESYRRRYERYVKRYAKDKERYEKELAKFRKLEREHKKQKSDFGFTSSLTNFSKKFTITLKNGKTLKARLVKLSKDHDLALLKVENCITPKLPLSAGRAPRQGTKVYAIGSPLGISDALTTGIVTKSDPRFLFTDTRILPGNSGGPLIDADGRVLGVNTAVVTGHVLNDGLGLVIYAKHIRSEFARELRGKL